MVFPDPVSPTMMKELVPSATFRFISRSSESRTAAIGSDARRSFKSSNCGLLGVSRREGYLEIFGGSAAAGSRCSIERLLPLVHLVLTGNIACGDVEDLSPDDLWKVMRRIAPVHTPSLGGQCPLLLPK